MKVEDLRIGMTVSIFEPLLHGEVRESMPMRVVAIFENGTVNLDFDGNESDVWEAEAKNLKLISNCEEYKEHIRTRDLLDCYTSSARAIHFYLRKYLDNNEAYLYPQRIVEEARQANKIIEQMPRKAVKAYCKACDLGKDINCKHDGDCVFAAEFLNELKK